MVYLSVWGWYGARMSLGFVMFGKALVLALWLCLVERWEAFRKGRGLPLRQNRRGVYVVSDWTTKVNAAARLIRNVNYALMVLIWIVVLWFSVR